MDIEGKRAVEYNTAYEYAQSKGYLFSEISALKGRNIQMIIKIITNRASKMVAPNNEQVEIRSNHELYKQMETAQ